VPFIPLPFLWNAEHTVKNTDPVSGFLSHMYRQSFEESIKEVKTMAKVPTDPVAGFFFYHVCKDDHLEKS
jgi:hypothetical protein